MNSICDVLVEHNILENLKRIILLRESHPFCKTYLFDNKVKMINMDNLRNTHLRDTYLRNTSI